MGTNARGDRGPSPAPVPMRYSLRPATNADRAFLDQLRRAAYAALFDATWGGWDEARHERHFAASWERGGIQVVEVDGAPVGMLQLREVDDGVQIAEIQLLPERQNRGLGTRLLRDVLERATERGRDVVLATGLKNTDACRLYARLGFAETERTKTHVHMRFRARPR